MTNPTEEQIRTRAYYLWEADGRPDGRDWEYWIRAKQEFEPKSQETVSAKPVTKKTSEPAINAPKRRNSTRAQVYA